MPWIGTKQQHGRIVLVAFTAMKADVSELCMYVKGRKRERVPLGPPKKIARQNEEKSMKVVGVTL